jgi:Flp pilus assembly protein TadD
MKKTIFVILLLILVLLSYNAYSNTRIRENNKEDKIKTENKVLEEKINSLKLELDLQKEINKNDKNAMNQFWEEKYNWSYEYNRNLFWIVSILLGTFLTIISIIFKKGVIDHIQNLSVIKVNEEVEKIITKEYVEKIIGQKGIEEINEVLKRYKELFLEIENKRFEISKKPSQEQKEKIEEIINITKKIKTEDKYTADDWYFKASHEYSKGNYNKTIEYLSKAIKLNPYDSEAYNDRGVAYNKKGDIENALSDYNKAIELNPNNEIIYINRANIYHDTRNDKKAFEDIHKAIELNPKYTDAYNSRGIIYGESGNNKKAYDDFCKVIELDPKNAIAYNNRGLNFLNNGDYENAIKDYKIAIKLDPKDIIAYNNLIEALILNSKSEKVFDYIKKVYSLNPKIEEMLMAKYFECLASKILNKDTYILNNELNEILMKDFKLEWSFVEIEKWINAVKFSNEIKNYIKEKTDLLKNKIKSNKKSK